MGKLGRNEPCYCGSGRKYKKCHLNQDSATREQRVHPGMRPMPESVRKAVQDSVREHAVKEAVRENQQGKGKPIISAELGEHRIVAVGNTLHWSSKESTQTFADFLNVYIRQVLGSEWGNSELEKPADQRHPIMNWYCEVRALKQKYGRAKGELYGTPATGSLLAYINLAYNLYLLGHNVEVQEHLLERLKTVESFHGAYYETYVAAWFILAGFKLELENEKDNTTRHCEFVATSPSGAKYSVEAKARQPDKEHLAIGNQLKKALDKAANHKRIIFIDMNLPMSADFSKEGFFDPISERIRSKETMEIQGSPAPEAYVIVTNQPFHLHLEKEAPFPRAFLYEGFKISDFGSVSFGSLIDAYRAYEKHSDLRRIVDAAFKYKVPETFDGELPEFAFGEAERLQTGAQYQFEDGKIGTLLEGIVLEDSQELIMVVDVNGEHSLYRGKLTDEELAAYRRHPETFFGEISNNNQGNAETPFDLFLFFYGTYKNSSRERLLELLQAAPDIEDLKLRSTEDLQLIYSERVTLNAISTTS